MDGGNNTAYCHIRKKETSAYYTFGKTISNSGLLTPHHLYKAIKKIQ